MSQPLETTKFDTSSQHPAQRRFARADVSIAVAFTIDGSAAPIQGNVSNLGGGGVRIGSRDDLERGSLLTMEFVIPRGNRRVTARGKIVLSFYDAASERFTHGIAFTQIAPEDQTEIIAFVESIGHSASDI